MWHQHKVYGDGSEIEMEDIMQRYESHILCR